MVIWLKQKKQIWGDRMKIIILSLFISIGLWAESSALFGKVINVTKNDTLNVRSQSNYEAKKVGEIPSGAYMGIEQCKTVMNSTWCRVYPLVQNFYENFWEEKNIGWVNARYLKLSNRGYVNITGEEKNCFYSLKCRDTANKKECLVVYDLKYDYEKDKMIEMKSKWIERKKLKGESMFGAVSENREINPEGGYCTKAKMIDNYLNISEKQ